MPSQAPSLPLSPPSLLLVRVGLAIVGGGRKGRARKKIGLVEVRPSGVVRLDARHSACPARPGRPRQWLKPCPWFGLVEVRPF
ncbi:MAG: hypothetical protein NTX45_04640 [Proteobacteria bacterium]|nr:hypothetical protein [Pseudomonadota bacterium]